MEKEIQRIYQEIAETVNEMIPEEWYEFYFYAQVSDTGASVHFYYNTEGNPNDYQYSVEIPFEFEVEQRWFSNLKEKLYTLADQKYDLFKKHNQELWYSFTMHVTSEGKLKVNYDYTDWFETDYLFSDQMVLWKHKYLGAKPKDAKKKALIKRYLEEFPDNPI